MKGKKQKKKSTKQIFALALVLVLLIAGSYAWLTLQLTGNKTNNCFGILCVFVSFIYFYSPTLLFGLLLF